MTQDTSPEAAAKLCLDQFLKWRGIVATGGQAKRMIQAGQVQVNGIVETRRRRQLTPGDVVTVQGQSLSVPHGT